MIRFAHRGLINDENSVSGVMKVFRNTDELGVEIDVRCNALGQVVLCHDKKSQNDPTLEKLSVLLETFRREHFAQKKRLMIDIKAHGTKSAEAFARAVVSIVESYTDVLIFYLCSFNEFCVAELIRTTTKHDNMYVGVITSGISLHCYEHWNLDFVSIDHEIVCQEIIDRFKQNHHGRVRWVFTWVVREPDCVVDGIIYNVVSI